MKLKLTLHQAGSTQPERHVLVTVDATANAGDVAAALAGAEEYGGVVPPAPLTLRVLDAGRGTSLDPAQTLSESGLRSGSRVEVATAAEAPGAGTVGAVLRVVQGPDAGLSVQLRTGSTDVGRSADCDVRLNDPSVSKRHARINVGQRVEIIDTNSANGVLVGGVPVSRVTLGVGDVAKLGDTEVTITPTVASAGLSTTSTDIAFVRSPRVLRRPAPERRELPEVPQAPDSAGLPVLAMIAPLLMGVVLFAVTKSVLSIVFVALSPLLMIGSYVDQRLQARRKLARSIADFDAALEVLRGEMDDEHAADRRALEALHPRLDECLAAAGNRTDLLWSRRPEHPEFLSVRLGTGTLAALHTLESPRAGRGLPEQLERAREVAATYASLTDAPAVADLRLVGGVGVCGDESVLRAVAGGLVAQLAVLHSPAEVVLACLASPRTRVEWEWLEWLPHASSPHSPLAGSHLAADPGTGALLLDRLEGLVAERRAALQGGTPVRGPLGSGEELPAPHLPSVVVVADDPSADVARLTRLAEQGPDVGVHFLWCAGRRQDLPASCRAFLDLTDTASPRVGLVRHELSLVPVRVESLGREHANHVARTLTPIVDAGSPVDDDSDLPRTVPVVQLLGADAADDPAVVVGRWRENGSLVDRAETTPRPRDRAVSLRALVGHAGSEPFALDLRQQGPHALVGGTTGAGKSEFLQAWVLGLAHALSPDRVTFLFVDYKGGAAFAECTQLPHCVGMVTDLSPYLVQRALRSLRAELHHRERLLRRKRVKDLVELEKTGDHECPPSLIIVVDEFAALKSEVPEFVDGLVDIAQRGRSLGLHLILATQQPGGVITDSLRANTNLRVALRMADETDSSDVLDTPMAAHFDPGTPGRAAAKTGPGRVATFQAGFPGSLTPSVVPPSPVLVEELDFGRPQVWRTPRPPETTEVLSSDMTRLVRTLRAAVDLAGVPAPRKPWQKTLAPICNLEVLRQRNDEELVLGVLDDPDHQTKVTEYFRPDADGNILYVGTGGTGKTTALRSLALAACGTRSGGSVHLYALDFAGGGLQLLEPLPAMAPVVDGDDEERVARLVERLSAVIDERAVLFRAAPADSLATYRRATGGLSLPRILLLIDGFGAMREAYDHDSARAATWRSLARILAEGRSYGVHVAVTADRPGALPMAMQSSFQRRVVMRQSDVEGYHLLNVPADVLNPKSPPGRCLQPEKPQELQLAILGTDASASAQAEGIREYAQALAQFTLSRPAPIEVLGAHIGAADVPPSVGGQPVLGISYTDLAPLGFDPSGIVVISGPDQSGRTSATRWLAESVRRVDPGARRILLTPRRTPLTVPGDWDLVLREADEIGERMHDLVQAASAEAGPGRRLVLVIEALPDLAGSMVDAELTDLVNLARRNGHLVVAEGHVTSWKYSDLVSAVKAPRTGLLLQPDGKDGDSVLQADLMGLRRQDFPPGRGVWVKSGRRTTVQVPYLG